MARTRRIVIPGLAHHLMLRGNNRRKLFSYPTEYWKLVTFIGQALERGDCHLHALTLMTNHVHCLVTPAGPDDLARFVKAFAQRYARYRNRRRGGSGKLFQERYMSKPIEDPSYLARVQLYIELNAWRAGMVNNPLLHRWSTFPIHAGQPLLSKIPLKYWTPSPWYQGIARTPEVRARRYLELVECVQAEKDGKDLDEHVSAIERAVTTPSRRRLERPDGTSAA